MILILSDSTDISTCHVIDWLRFYQVPYLVITEQDPILIDAIFPDGEFQLNVGGIQVRSDAIRGMWYRRGALKLANIQLSNSFALTPLFDTFNRMEYAGMVNYLYYRLTKIHHLGNYFKANINKLFVLDVAREVGLLIPPTLVTTSRADLLAFKAQQGALITKSAVHPVFFGNEELFFYAYTEEVTDEWIDELPEQFNPSLFQKMIEKDYELRVFYLDKTVYPMAIFSQLDPQTSVDFRRYNRERPNRRVPVMLPPALEQKLVRLMEACRMNTGSIDIIYGKDKQYYFLEVNHIGQFGMTSHPCNYQLEREVAKYLMKNQAV